MVMVYYYNKTDLKLNLEKRRHLGNFYVSKLSDFKNPRIDTLPKSLLI